MKTTSLFTLLFILLVNFTIAYSQNEIKNYEPPEVIEGSNLIIEFSPSYYDRGNDVNKNRNANINAASYYTNWKFTRKFDYSFSIKPSFYLSKNEIKYSNLDTSFNRSAASISLFAAGDYYLYRNLAYVGVYTNNNFNFENGSKPFSSHLSSAFIGTGKIVNAEMVKAVDNFEDILISEKIINDKLSFEIKKKLTHLFDKRDKREFLAKFKDDNEVEFFTQVESFLIDNSIIKTPLGSRAVIKLYQALTNRKFLYFPFYKGYQVQLSSNFSHSTIYYGIIDDDITDNSDRVKKDLSISGMWGIPLNNKTELINTLHFSFPVDDMKYSQPIYSGFQSPVTIKEENSIRTNFRNPIRFPFAAPLDDYSYFAGISTSVFHYLSSTIGLTGNLSYAFAKARKTKADQYNISANTNFIYNILNSLSLSAGAAFNRVKDAYFFVINTGLRYYIF